jgi:hypothetical protein
MTEILIGLFLIFILIREWQHSKEVKLLSEAVIAKNIYEYKDAQVKPEKLEEDKPPKIVPVENISDDEFLNSIKKQLGTQTKVSKVKQTLNKLWPKR